MVARIKKAKTGVKKVKKDIKEIEEVKKDVENEDKKDEKKDNGNKTTPSDAEKEKLLNQAVAEIEAELAKPEIQAQGFQILEGWSARFKTTLGGFKKFVASQADKFTVCERGDSSFIIVKKGAKPPAAFLEKKNPKNEWQTMLKNAWTRYCQATPKEDRSTANFIKALPDSGQAGESSEAPVEEAQSKNDNKGKKAPASQAERTPPAKKKKVVKKK